MAHASLSRLPTELVCHIFEQCNTPQDLLMLGATCRRLRAIFDAEVGRISWAIGNRTLPAFDLALIAVRATKIVCDSLSADNLPPVHHLYPVQRLSGTSRLPTIDELRHINDLQHFGRCVEHLILLNAPRRQPEVWFEPGVTVLQATVGWPRDHPQFPEAQHLWRQRLYRNIFRLMICGACLSAPYHQPFFYQGPSKPKTLHQPLRKPESPRVTAKEFNFLLWYPVYSGTYFSCLPAEPDELEVIGPLAQWLADDMGQASQREGDTLNRYGEKIGQWPLVMQVLHCIWTLQQLNTLIAPALGLQSRGDMSVFVPRKVNRGSNSQKRPDEIPLGLGRTRSITVVLPGIYQPETITMPARPGDQFIVLGASTRHNLLSSTHSEQIGKTMTVNKEHLDTDSQIILSKVRQHMSYYNHPSYGWPASWNHRVFACILQTNGGMHPLESNRMFYDASKGWTCVVSILALRHDFESELEQIVRRRLPENYGVPTQAGSLPLSF